jgi:sulfate permease, SulP family
LALRLPHYDRTWLRADLVAGVTSWALVVPQAVAYAQIAGMPAQAGLAAAFTGPLGYALLGTSRQLMVTPTSSAATISAALVAPLAAGDPARFLALSAMLAILTGIVLMVLGWLRLGFVSQFLAVSVQVGFMFGLGMVITIGQVPKVLGIAPVGEDFFPALWSVLTNLGNANLWSIALGLGGLAALLLMKRFAPAAPGALLVVAVGILLTATLGLEVQGVAVVGTIPQGLPLPALPQTPLADVIALLPAALVI